MRLNLLLLFVITFSSVFSQNQHISGLDIPAEKVSNTGKQNALERHRLWLDMTNTEGAFKQLLIGYIQGATNNIDNEYDGPSLDANPYIDFYSVNSGVNLVIQGRALPFSDVDEVILGYRTTITGKFTISIDHYDGLFAQQAVYIEDKKTNIIHDLKASNYTFITDRGTFNDRFVIRYKNYTLNNYSVQDKTNEVAVWSDKQNITISSNFETIDKVFVYTISGELLYSNNEVSSNEIIINDIASDNKLLFMKIMLRNNQIDTKKIIY